MAAFIERNDYSLDVPTVDSPEMDVFEELLDRVASGAVSEAAFAGLDRCAPGEGIDYLAAYLSRQCVPTTTSRSFHA
jgi:hypothetical protein